MTFDFIHGYNYKSNAYDVVEIKFENHVPRSRVGIIIFLLLISVVCMDDVHVCLYVIILHWYHLSPLSSISALYSTPLWHLQCERGDDISVWGEDECGEGSYSRTHTMNIYVDRVWHGSMYIYVCMRVYVHMRPFVAHYRYMVDDIDVCVYERRMECVYVLLRLCVTSYIYKWV